MLQSNKEQCVCVWSLSANSSQFSKDHHLIVRDAFTDPAEPLSLSWDSLQHENTQQQVLWLCGILNVNVCVGQELQ